MKGVFLIMVYVISKEGKPLMPTERHGMVRRLLKDHKAIVIKKVPFTIQLLYEVTEFTQPVTLGVDSGYKYIGLSATTETKELYAEEVTLRTNIVELISSRREARKTRRSKHTRYRKPRFNNRGIDKGWIAPSVRQKIDSHISVIEKVYEILPISLIRVEVASFDIQKIKNPDISGIEYQQGEQLGFWNVREYVLWRDSHKCQCCKGRSGDKRLNVHHIESRKTGGNAPNDLITLCETCHNNYHAGLIKLPAFIKRGISFKAETFMGIMRWRLYDALKNKYSHIELTYGYITKNIRIRNNLGKTHCVDARCISNNPLAIPSKIIYFSTKLRRHNRKIYKDKILKNGIKKRNQCPNEVFRFRLNDIVMYENEYYIVQSRRTSGQFQIQHCITGKRITKTYKKLRFIRHSNGFLIIPKLRNASAIDK